MQLKSMKIEYQDLQERVGKLIKSSGLIEYLEDRVKVFTYNYRGYNSYSL